MTYVFALSCGVHVVEASQMRFKDSAQIKICRKAVPILKHGACAIKNLTMFINVFFKKVTNVTA